ncbi:RNA polymerase sigma-B factor [Abditibacterium utsteinense]|uniref:RNA polymerase sigma-B factor n=1 Tax=Abditibacterium utsteinense TaxID=1960156 RepID=A0A2S8SX42_9BACT|nr:SigB/SigF/SigG family RNA polymerase sigma factor [Abditibacterium utsteinense]PQV65319.1 RNA polymerase sigma-B factor [Abditibacterium utsteinense]
MESSQFPSHGPAEEAELVSGEAELNNPVHIPGQKLGGFAGASGAALDDADVEGADVEGAENDEDADEESAQSDGQGRRGASDARRKSSATKIDQTKVDAANFDDLFAQWKQSSDPQLRERLILSQRSMVVYLARRFMDRGELFEDVMQIGMVGLINALDGFDSSRGIRFSTFAIPSISGEIRRYFRDKVSGMRVPRRMQELYAMIQNRIEEMTQKLDRSPTYAEIAAELKVEVEEVVETMELGYALDPQSLDDHVFGEEGSVLSDTIGGLDPDLMAYEEHASLQMALSRLTEKERRVLELAYFEGHSQVEIARRLGVSQMHISRLLRRALTELRHLLEDI